MKTPEEIKKGLECCSTYNDCQSCPYDDKVEKGWGCCVQRNEDALAYIQQLEAKVPKWISVKDTLPEKKQRVMVYTTQGAYRLGVFSFVGKEGAVWFKCDRSCISCTHWMPLPSAPEVQE